MPKPEQLRYLVPGTLILLAVACSPGEPGLAPQADIDATVVAAVEGTQTALGSRTPSPVPSPPTPIPVDIKATVTAAIEATLSALPTVTSTPSPEPTPTHEAMVMEDDPVQEIALIENYAATRFFPRNIVVLKDIPVRLYLTRLHREHVNKFDIVPFFNSSEVILPGEIGIMEFIPDQVGEFKIRNVGHNFEANLVVVETREEARAFTADRGVQMFALIHSVDDFRLYPDTLIVQEGVPVTFHNISLIAEHQVSIKPFHDPANVNVMPGEITQIQFTPDDTGVFTIQHELHGFTGELVVEAGLVP